MLGLMYLGAVVIYLALMFFVVRWAWRTGRVKNGSVAKGAGFALLSFLAVCLPVCWSLLPTVLVHRQFCTTDSGFQAFITPAQWAAKHADLIERLRGVDLVSSVKAPETADGFVRDVDFAGVRAWDYRISKATNWGVEVTRVEQRIVDLTDGVILARSVDYSTGSRDDVAIWLVRPSCFSQEDSPIRKLVNFSFDMKGVVK